MKCAADSIAVARSAQHHHRYPIPADCRLSVCDMNVNTSATTPPPVCLRRDRPPGPALPSFNPPQHPHCRSTDNQVHPSTTIQRTLTVANDNSSLVRQSRSHVVRPDPVPGIIIVLLIITLLIIARELLRVILEGIARRVFRLTPIAAWEPFRFGVYAACGLCFV